MESIEWHIRLIERLIKNNCEATIKDYFGITDGYQNKEQTKLITVTGAYDVLRRSVEE